METLHSADGTALMAEWHPARGARGTLVFVHGYGEHIGRYSHTFTALLQRGWSCFGFDLRGHGRSAGRRAFIRSFDEYLDDVDAALAAAEQRAPGAPTFLVGHSMGGLIALLHALERRPRLLGVALSAPALGLAVRVPGWKRALARAASRLLPTLSMRSGIEAGVLTHDAEIAQATRTDPLFTHAATARWFTELVSAQERVHASAGGLHIAALFLIAGDDRLCDPACTRSLASRTGPAPVSCVEYPDHYHELFNEVERARVFEDLDRWLGGCLKGQEGT